MTRRLVFRPAARADLDAIWDYTADRWGVAQADAYVRDLHTACIALTRDDRASLDASDIRPGYPKLRSAATSSFTSAPLKGLSRSCASCTSEWT